MAAPGSRPEEGAGLPGMGQFRLDIGVGIDGDAGPDDDYRPSPDASSGRAPAQGQHGAAAGGQFGILAPPTMLSGAMEGHSDGARHVSFTADSHETQRKRPGKIVVDPPDLRAWREKLFNVDAMIVLTDEQYVLLLLPLAYSYPPVGSPFFFFFFFFFGKSAFRGVISPKGPCCYVAS